MGDGRAVGAWIGRSPRRRTWGLDEEVEEDGYVGRMHVWVACWKRTGRRTGRPSVQLSSLASGPGTREDGEYSAESGPGDFGGVAGMLAPYFAPSSSSCMSQ